jgi:hypothetical protein
MQMKTVIYFTSYVMVLAILVARAKQNEQVDGLIPHLVDGVLPILRNMIFRDSTKYEIIFLHLRWLSGLRLIFIRVKYSVLVKRKEVKDKYRDVFGSEVGSLLF